LSESELEAREEQIDLSEITGRSNRRGRGVLAAVLLLLMLLCAISTIGGTYITRGGDRVIVENIASNMDCLQCHPEVIPQFYWDVVHDPFAKKHCTTCHTPHGEIESTTVIDGWVLQYKRVRTLVEWLPLKLLLDVFDTGEDVEVIQPGGNVSSETTRVLGPNDSVLVMPETELCYMCHADFAQYMDIEFPHKPVADGYCTSCHHPHASNLDALALIEARDLCLMCHNVAADMAKSHLHEPFGNRDCLACHAVHGSRHAGMLPTGQRDLCFSCHPEIARLSSKGYQHHPFLSDNCTACHDVHSSDFPKLLVKETPQLCYDCHPEIQADFGMKSHHPVGTLIECSSCHDSHASDYPYLLNAEGNEICYQCHPQIRVTYEPSAHTVPCWTCHTAHGSPYPPLLIKPQPWLCFPCHPRAGYDDRHGGYYNHPVRSSFYDPHAKKALTCTTTCHNPHGTIHNYMLRYYDWPEDGRCLICHKAKDLH